jgi:hypothetical protein
MRWLVTVLVAAVWSRPLPPDTAGAVHAYRKQVQIISDAGVFASLDILSLHFMLRDIVNIACRLKLPIFFRHNTY